MSPEELLPEVVDRETFVAFVKALANERDDAARMEKDDPQRYCVDGAHDWKNADIASYLHACLDYFTEKPFHEPELGPTWRMLADFLYFGKIIE